ncbi:aminotransferase class V-fold PLP-dependent enzyme [Streptomyces kunmingensis]|uniref:Aminotransferase class V-fold PLP-dependent enzyme n=1 Tax=Streptomyces kunmingensis TaxID=68225 RepID=A0ABU6C1R9_9ACTN|nr:aminotransferase class V-fold PLP-dependent enzyme [Streptomyces kunmingensis]MEB3958653.1 aminotransferase class V-fold PLP-dependent enzyme [Streptomyces kunmingensis]
MYERGGTGDQACTDAVRGEAYFARIRADEYGYLDEPAPGDRASAARGTAHIYLDHTGSGLPARRQLRLHAARMTGAAWGNPHTDSPASAPSTALVEEARRRILAYAGADPADYTVVFTANATTACRLVGEAYPFRRRHGDLLLTLDNHNSVNGLREFARARHGRTTYVPLSGPDLRLDEERLAAALAERRRGLFAFPAQSNFSGVRHPLEWIGRAQEQGWQVLLDAAAYAPTSRLELSRFRPEFTVLSWYKVFGYPTGVGCLIARHDALAALRRPWFSGGTIQVVSAHAQWHRMAEGPAAFEDGTVNFHAIPEIITGLDWIEEVGVDAIRAHVERLTARLLARLTELRHDTGQPLVRLYGPDTTHRRGGTVALNVLDEAGRLVDERLIARDSAAAGISLRAGCFCNPGAGEAAFAIGAAQLARTGRHHHGLDTIDAYLDHLGLPTGGAVRVSLGLSSTAGDVDAFVDFLRTAYRNRTPDAQGLTARLTC